MVLFWLGSVAWLCAVVWAPPGSRMARVEPEQVYATFFNWNDSTEMTLLDHGVRRGKAIVAGGAGVDRKSGVFERTLSFSLSFETYDEGSGFYVGDQLWKGSLGFAESMELLHGEISARIPKRDLTAHFRIGPGSGEDRSPAAHVSVTMGNREIFSFDPAVVSDGAASAMLGSLGGLTGLGGLDPASLAMEAEAREGSYTLAGREMRAILLELRFPEQEQAIRVYLSEIGEPLRIETGLGLEAVSEILVPLDAYKRPTSAPSPND
ncbi:MAG TPA: hypothetical protein PLA50_02045 [Bacteroidia bacterium]|nr:hypothetical protein [Bacteroidia bacterium]